MVELFAMSSLHLPSYRRLCLLSRRSHTSGGHPCSIVICNGPSVDVSSNRKVRLTCTNSIGCLLGHGVACRPAHGSHPQNAAGKHQIFLHGAPQRAQSSSTQYQVLEWKMSVFCATESYDQGDVNGSKFRIKSLCWEQGCIFRLTCSHPELTEDHVLTSAYVKFLEPSREMP